MARQQVNYEGSSEGLRTTAAPRVTGVTARFDPRSSSAFQLAEALGAVGPLVSDITDKVYKQTEREQLLKVDSYKARFLQDFEGGAVTQAQLKEVFPELVPLVRARVMESIGKEQGKQHVQGLIEEINMDDSIRLDSTRRTEFLKQRRSEILQNIGEGDDFALAGIVSGIDAELNQWENSWQRETAKYHEQVQSNAFSEEVVNALRSGTDLEAVDAKWKASSSLNNLERNQLVVKAAINEAFATNSTAVLSKIPERFLNAETKADLETAKRRVQEVRLSKLREAEYYRELARKQEMRESKLQILNDRANNRPIRPEMYLNDPDTYLFALQSQNTAIVPTAMSAASAAKVRNSIMDFSTTVGMDPDQVIDAVANNPEINPEDKAKLIGEIPQLLEGRMVLNDPMVKNAFSNQLNARLDILEKSVPSLLAATTEGRSLRADAQRSFELELRNRFMAYREDNGSWPTGRAKQEIVDEATEKAGRFVENSVQALMSGGSRNTPPPARGSNTNTPQLPRVTTNAEFEALPSGAEFLDPNGVRRRKP
jgi:hypothetical protein